MIGVGGIDAPDVHERVKVQTVHDDVPMPERYCSII